MGSLRADSAASTGVLPPSSAPDHRRLSVAVLTGLLLDLVSKLSPLLVLRHVQVTLGLAGFGAAQYQLALFEALQPFVVYGFTNYALARVGDDAGEPVAMRRLLSSIFLLKTLNALVVLAVYLARFGAGHGTMGILAAVLAASVLDAYWVMIARRRLAAVNLATSALRVVSLVLTFALVRSPADGPLFVWITLLPNAAVACLTGAVAFRVVGWIRPTWRAMAGHLASATPFAIVIALSTLFDRLDLFWVEHWYGAEAAGVYSGPYKVVQSLALLLGATAVPFYAESIAVRDPRRLLASVSLSLWVLMALAAPMVFGVPFVEADVRALVFPESPATSHGLLSLLAAGLVFWLLFPIFGIQILMARSRPWALIRAFLAASAAVSLLVGMLHGSYDYMMVAACAVGGKAIVGLYLAHQGRAYLAGSPWWIAVKPLLAGLVMGGILQLTRWATGLTSPAALVPLGGIAYLAALAIISRRELALVLARPGVRAWLDRRGWGRSA